MFPLKMNELLDPILIWNVFLESKVNARTYFYRASAQHWFVSISYSQVINMNFCASKRKNNRWTCETIYEDIVFEESDDVDGKSIKIEDSDSDIENEEEEEFERIIIMSE